MRKTSFNSFEFAPGDPGGIKSQEDTIRYIRDLEVRLQTALTALAQMKLERMYAPPPKPRDGMLVLADGVQFDPGSGRGLYVFDEQFGTYVQLG